MHHAQRHVVPGHHQRADIVLVKQRDRRAGKRLRIDRLGRAGHHLVDDDVGQIAVQIARDIAVGDDPGQFAIGVDDQDAADLLLRQRHDRFRHLGAQRG